MTHNQRLFRIALGLGMLLITGLGAVWLLTEPYETTEELGPSWRARQNPLLALERLYTGLGVKTSSYPTLYVPPEAQGSVIVLASNQAPEPDEVEALQAYLDAGGRLVYAPGDSTAEDPLLAQWGLSLAHEPEEGEAEVEAVLEFFDLDHPRAQTRVYSPWNPDRSYTLNLRSDTPLVDNTLGCPALDVTPAEDGTLQVCLTAGGVLVLNDLSVLDNKHLGQEDHALFAWDAVLGSSERVVLVYRTQGESLLSYLWTRAWPLIISLLALVIVWMATAAQRFGPVLPDPEPNRRRLGEALERHAAYLWRVKEAPRLIEALRAEVLAQRFGGRLPTEARTLEQLAKGLQLTPEDLRWALTSELPPGPAPFVRAVGILNTLRRRS